MLALAVVVAGMEKPVRQVSKARLRGLAQLVANGCGERVQGRLGPLGLLDLRQIAPGLGPRLVPALQRGTLGFDPFRTRTGAKQVDGLGLDPVDQSRDPLAFRLDLRRRRRRLARQARVHGPADGSRQGQAEQGSACPPPAPSQGRLNGAEPLVERRKPFGTAQPIQGETEAFDIRWWALL